MYNKIKEDISQEYYTKTFPNDGQRFIAWYLRNIFNLDEYETKDCITDGAGDKQIDAVYINNQNSTIYIIQGKFYEKENIDSKPLREVLSSWIQIQNLEELQNNANEKLKVKITEIASALDDDYSICFELITTSELTDSAKNDLEIFQKTISENDKFNANLIVIDNETLQTRYNEALNMNRPYINHNFSVESNKYMEMYIGNKKAVIAAIPLKECIKIPGIKDGSLFRKNVRQSLGMDNKVNKGIAHTLRSDPEKFFFLHNGITAICSSINIDNGIIKVEELNVVNGCQSLNTIFNCSQSIRNAANAYIMFRFYEINDSEYADDISTSTNSQSTVKARDLRSNDKNVLMMKKDYEQYFSDGYFITKRGEFADPLKYNTAHIVDLTLLGKQLIAWHSQRPTISYSESKIFDKYFGQLFHREYKAENIQALHELYDNILKNWNNKNPLRLNEALLAMKAYIPFHHLYAISLLFCEVNQMHDLVPNPYIVLEKLKNNNLLNTVIKFTAQSLNIAFEIAREEAINNNKVFSPQNWSKAKASLKDIRNAVKGQYSTLELSNKDFFDTIDKALQLEKENFESRWAAD
ncbi:AIPR family protein [Brachyspira hyodysenteriae]|uniref:AIPR family protein n=1 Tax=Brachyspira hyodysenteriae TaxID=159 RepID=UPI00063DA607|nr:AIPR family protein [Brachyspira hyodysenteriae]KLI29651.1 AIPR protein [Brachyspira hyodysenteriae]